MAEAHVGGELKRVAQGMMAERWDQEDQEKETQYSVTHPQ